MLIKEPLWGGILYFYLPRALGSVVPVVGEEKRKMIFSQEQIY